MAVNYATMALSSRYVLDALNYATAFRYCAFALDSCSTAMEIIFVEDDVSGSVSVGV